LIDAILLCGGEGLVFTENMEEDSLLSSLK